MNRSSMPLSRLAGVASALVATVGVVLIASYAQAAPAKSVNAPSSQSKLRDAYRALAKRKNYTVKVQVDGGLSDNTDHRIVTSTVDESYEGRVFGRFSAPILEIPSIKAFKMPKAGHGVIWAQGQWKRILATEDGVKMDRLVDFPSLVLAEAYKHAKSARWLEESEIPKGFVRRPESRKPLFDLDLDDLDLDDDEDEEEGDDDSADGGERGRTVVGDDGDSEDAEKLPRVLRVEAPPQQALKTWIERVENSGCMREG